MIKLSLRTLHQFLPRGIRTHRICGGMLRGEKIVTSWQDYPAGILGYTERRLLYWFRQNVKPGQTWLDIGAHYGFTAIALSRLVGSEGRVFAFEPMLSTAGYLGQTRRLNGLKQLTVLPIGLAAPETLAMIGAQVTRGMVDSTIERNTKDNENAEWIEGIVVARFDWLWPMICGDDNENRRSEDRCAGNGDRGTRRNARIAEKPPPEACGRVPSRRRSGKVSSDHRIGRICASSNADRANRGRTSPTLY